MKGSDPTGVFQTSRDRLEEALIKIVENASQTTDAEYIQQIVNVVQLLIELWCIPETLSCEELTERVMRVQMKMIHSIQATRDIDAE